jgi:DNA polymerase-3 subunit gamma/tau
MNPVGSTADSPTTNNQQPTTEYRVLARKYRPTNFGELIGQEVLVKTLSNAIQTGRIAHAFILTGVRGIGKTTTARIIARALNCERGPTIDPCGVCEHCTAIAQDRHLDVMEMDAASRTGVDDIREIIDGVRYRPASARFKIYIIDEVHMLSKNAFNALLKTLEEPPPTVKFIFATTEIHKLPITVLSRCQRFDLRRLDTEQLAAHLTNIGKLENYTLAPEAARLLGQAADGSVRDGLSLLDQAIAMTDGGAIEAEAVRRMLGLVDHTEIYTLLDHILAGEIVPALQLTRQLFQSSADPLLLAQDLLRAAHAVTRTKVAGEDDPGAAPSERDKRRAIAEKISIGNLSRLWQMLLKGIGEIQTASNSLMALEMVLIRIAYAADLPNPAQLAEQIAATPPPPPGGSRVTSAIGTAPIMTRAIGTADSNLAVQPMTVPSTEVTQSLHSFAEVVQLFATKREMILYHDLYNHTHVVQFAPGKLELRIGPNARQANVGQIGKLLQEWTGLRWIVSVSNQPGEPSLAEQDRAKQAALTADVTSRPEIQAVLLAFPGAKVVQVRPRAQSAQATIDDESTVFEELL